MDEKIEKLLNIINEILKNNKPTLCFNYEKNNGNYNDVRIKYLYEKLPFLIQTQIYWIIDEGMMFNDYSSTSFVPGTVNSQLPPQNIYFKQSIPDNYDNLYETFIHEFAHIIDEAIGFIVNNSTFGFSNDLGLISEEIEKIGNIQRIPTNSLQYLNKEGYDINKQAYKYLNYYKYAGLVDILDALSNGNLYMNYRKNIRDITAVPSGHGKLFTDQIIYKVSEIFADYITMKIMCPDSIKALGLDFPNLIIAIENTINCMVQELQKNFKSNSI